MPRAKASSSPAPVPAADERKIAFPAPTPQPVVRTHKGRADQAVAVAFAGEGDGGEGRVVEKLVIDSILEGTPKRADVYWFLHIDRTNEPYTMEYEAQELVDDLIIKVNIKYHL